jgi:hypothetical protein
VRALARSVASAVVASAMALTFAAPAAADGGDLLMAEVLFRDGRELLARKDFAHACPKLSESYRLDPATGTLLALALCHEGQGKLASAWGEYVDAASRARSERRGDRESAARARAADLEAKYSTITIVLADGAALPGLEIRRNGVVVAPVWLGTAVPIDGGTVTIDAAAPGHPAWRSQIAIAAYGDHQTVVVPSLDAAAAPVRAPAPAPPPAAPAPRAVLAPTTAPGTVAPAEPPGAFAIAGPAPADASATAPAAPASVAATPALGSSRASHHGLTPLQVSGIVLTAVGVAGVGVGAGFGLVAMQKNSDSHSQCMGDLCTDTGKQSRKAAVDDGNVATAAFIAGPIVAAIGAAMIIFGRHTEAPSATAASVQALPLLGPGVVGGSLSGEF